MPTMSPALMVVEIKRLERLIDDAWPSVCWRRGRGEHEQPARRNHADAERQVAWINEVNGHRPPPQPEGTVEVKTTCVTKAAVDIVTLLRGSSVAVRKLGG